MAIIMGKGCNEAIYGLMGWKGSNSSNSLKIMIENNLINDNQFGFVPGRPTQQAVFETTCDLYHAMNSNLLTGLPRCPEGF